MIQRAFRCDCGVEEVLVARDEAVLADHEVEAQLRHSGPGHALHAVPVEDVAPAPVPHSAGGPL